MPGRIIVFDVNETLLDLGALDPLFAELLGDAGARRDWFGLMLRWSMVVTLTGAFRDFSALADASLTAVAEERGATLAEADRARVFEGIRACRRTPTSCRPCGACAMPASGSPP